MAARVLRDAVSYAVFLSRIDFPRMLAPGEPRRRWRRKACASFGVTKASPERGGAPVRRLGRRGFAAGAHKAAGKPLRHGFAVPPPLSGEARALSFLSAQAPWQAFQPIESPCRRVGDTLQCQFSDGKQRIVNVARNNKSPHTCRRKRKSRNHWFLAAFCPLCRRGQSGSRQSAKLTPNND